MNNELAVKIEDVSKTFKLPHEKNATVKGAVINFYKRNKTFEIQEALKNISFEVKKGEFFCIVGRNGSGKSTLLKLLAEIYDPDKGSVQINGTLTPFIELGVGFSPELTGRENVFLNGALFGFSRKEMASMYNDIVEFAELSRFMDQKLKNYSSGMQVRLAFSIAIRAESDILLLDEVLAVGDAAFQQKCFDYFNDLKDEKKTVIFVSHDMSAVQRFCNRGIYLDNGKIIKVGKALDIAEMYQRENFEQAEKSKKGVVKPSKSSLKVSITKQDLQEKKVDLKFRYKTFFKGETYIGFSVLKDGITFAEINSLAIKSSNHQGVLGFVISTEQLNPGNYEVSAVLFSKKNKTPLSITSEKAQFTISGYDEQRGGPLFLNNNWENLS